MKITNFTIMKNKYKTEGSKQPDYNLSGKEGEKFVQLGAAWLKEGKDGSKYFSIQLKEGLAITGEVAQFKKKEEGASEDF